MVLYSTGVCNCCEEEHEEGVNRCKKRRENQQSVNWKTEQRQLDFERRSLLVPPKKSSTSRYSDLLPPTLPSAATYTMTLLLLVCLEGNNVNVT